MLNLLRADLFKLKKDRTVIIALIIIFAFSFINPILFTFLKSLPDMEMPEQFSALLGEATGKGVFLMGFNIFNNVGLIFPIMLCLFMGKEFQYGTIRNKLIAGKTREQVYLSNLIIGLVYGIILVTFLNVLSLLIGSIILGFGSTFTFSTLAFILKAYLSGLFVFIVSFSISTFLVFVTRNLTITLVINLFFLLILGIVATTLSGINDTIDKIFGFTILGQTISLISGQVTTTLMVKSIITGLITASLITYLGIFIFKKADLK